MQEAQGLWQGIADAQEQAEAKLREQIDSRVSEHSKRVTELSQATEAEVESRVVATLDERLAAMEASLEASTQAIVERASTLVYEQVRRGDAAELERTRIARASLKGFGDEVDRIRTEAALELEADRERMADEVRERQREAGAAMEARLAKQMEAAVSKLNERFDAMETRTADLIDSQVEALRRRGGQEIEALADRAGVLVYERIHAADSRVEAAVMALAREIDGMRSALRAGGEVPAEPLPVPVPATPEPPPPPYNPRPADDLPPGLEFVPMPDPAPRFPRLRRAFRLGG